MKASEGDTASGAPASGWLLWMPWAMTGCFALLCVALIAIGHRLREQAVVMQQRLAGQVSDQAELQRQLAHGGQLVAGCELPGGPAMAHLLHNLRVNGFAAPKVQLHLHRRLRSIELIVSLSHCITTGALVKPQFLRRVSIAPLVSAW